MANGEYSIETRVAKLEQSHVDTKERLTRVEATFADVVKLSSVVSAIQQDLTDERNEREQERKQERDDRQKTKALLWTIAAMLACSLIAAAATIIAVTIA